MPLSYPMTDLDSIWNRAYDNGTIEWSFVKKQNTRIFFITFLIYQGLSQNTTTINV